MLCFILTGSGGAGEEDKVWFKDGGSDLYTDGNVTLFSDSFVRFGFIPEISDLILRSGRS